MRSSSSSQTSATSLSSAFDGIDGVINLSGLSNDPTAEFNPEANWQMNAIATETLGRSCVERESIGTCSRRRARCTTDCRRACMPRTRDVQPRGGVCDLQALRRGAAARAHRRGAVPGDPSQRDGVRLEPSDALRPRRQHVREGRAAGRVAEIAWRRLDVATARRHLRLRRRDDCRATRRRRRRCAARSSTSFTPTTRFASWR